MIKESITIPSSLHEKAIYADFRYNNGSKKKPLIIFVHGFKGFKDWGTFNLMADHFAQNDMIFLKMNLSHNGLSPTNQNEITDKEAFGQNTISIELNDVKDVLDYIFSENSTIPKEQIDFDRLVLMGHSRGGGLVILKAAQDKRVKKVVTMAAISDLAARYPKSFLEEWKQKGVQYVVNGRTGEKLPMYSSLLDDILEHPETHDIPTAVKKLEQPLLNFHGTEDETLPVEMAHQIKAWNSRSELVIMEGENHVFGAQNPWTLTDLPKSVQKIVEESSAFIKD